MNKKTRSAVPSTSYVIPLAPHVSERANAEAKVVENTGEPSCDRLSALVSFALGLKTQLSLSLATVKYMAPATVVSGVVTSLLARNNTDRFMRLSISVACGVLGAALGCALSSQTDSNISPENVTRSAAFGFGMGNILGVLATP